MRFTKIRYNGLTVVDFPIIGAKPQDLYICKGVEGLGPPEIQVSLSNTLNAGGFYQGRRALNKQLVALIGLNPNHALGQTSADLRTDLYGLLSPASDDSITVQFVDDEDVVAYIVGYVAKMEINPFTDTPEVQVTTDCDSPYFKAPEELFIEPASKTDPEIENVGTAPAGFHMEVLFTAPESGWSLTHISGRKMEIDYEFLSGDLLTIDTRPGSREISVVRSSVKSNIIYALTEDSVWFMLHGGVNIFSTSSSAFDWGDVFFQPQFWGI